MYVEFVISSVVIALSIVLYLKISSQQTEKKNVTTKFKPLPGPLQFPIVGSLPSLLFKIGRNALEKSSFDLLCHMRAIWGSPIGIKVGSTNAVIIDDIKTARKLMISEDWANRLDDNPLWYKRSFDNHYGLLISNGESWKEMRKFIHKFLGLGRSRALEMIHEIEILNFFEHLNKMLQTSQSTVNMHGIFNVTTLNILWKMVAGSRFSYSNSEEISNLVKLLEEFAHAVHPKEMGFLVFPWLRHFPSICGFEKIIDNHRKMQNFFLNIINERRRSGSYKEKQETFIDVFLKEIDLHKEDKVPNHYTDEQFAMVLVDLFVTGFIPTASCLEFLVMFMVLHPEIQKKCHEEIDTVIGRKRFPSINDNEKMPYTQAVCLEVLRQVTFIPMTTRSATRDTQVDGYFIPKGTIATLNLYGMHHDKNVWDKPDEFHPERFLDEFGQLSNRNQDLMLPFGTGKRVCPAEVFARVSTFTYFAYLLQRYSFECPAGEKAPDPTPNVGMGNYAKPFRCVIRERHFISSVVIADIPRKNDNNEQDTGTLV